ncbi:methyl-accepting chemotaxis sensory transducer [Desulfovibrio sp. X2]|uniref:methyl-accepting chemotaxis protein n=1 Tax=Desulfovibrio sp. X2 TaxID=941449 RepID=UPI000358A5F0|nr:methyl-accepting chemotaxis protein [Desulfovibrio sp. X2]EPR36334.1 methyl-accepting chemotaxis sensory transducer [Desulfovibrio sp. X2]
MLKDVKLGVKLGLGFGLLILLSCGLGVLAVYNMTAVSRNSGRLAQEFVPEVAIANNVERSSLQAMLAMRSYSLSENHDYWVEGSKHLNDVHAFLDQAQKHAQAHPRLVALKKDVGLAQAKVDEYTTLAGQTDEMIRDLSTVRKQMDASAAAFMKNANAYLADQQIKARLAAAGDGSVIDRLQKLAWITEVIETGEEIRVRNFKSQSLRDPAYIKEGIALFPKMEDIVGRMRALSTDDKNVAQLDAIKAAAEGYKQAMTEFLAKWENLRALDGKRNTASEAVLGAARDTATAGIGHTQELADAAVDSLSLASKVVIGGLVAAVVLGIAIALLLTRAITGPMARGVAYATKVADGDLDQVLDVHQKDEAGQLAAAMSRMVENLKEKIAEAEEQQQAAAAATKEAQGAMSRAQAKEQEVRGLLETMGSLADQAQSISERMSSASEELAAQVEQVTRGTQEQSERMGETATAMEEMNATVIEVARNAADASSSADKARAKAGEGADVVGQAVSGIGEVHAITRDLQENMVDLGHKAESIGEVMNVISDIADQTNLLALNAAIEAARAGDAGRGFAVVADEVRKLAEKTMGATKEVGESILSIQQAARQSQEKMQSAAKAVERVTDLAGRSGEALSEIVELVGGSARQVEGIATAAEQQSAASEEINRAIEQVSRIVAETADGMAQSSLAVQEVATMSGELNQIIARLKQDGAG